VAKTAATESLINSLWPHHRGPLDRVGTPERRGHAARRYLDYRHCAAARCVHVARVFLDLPIWTLLVIWFPILWLAEKLTSWIVPNIPGYRLLRKPPLSNGGDGSICNALRANMFSTYVQHRAQ
jgi:hypothetical protein